MAIWQRLQRWQRGFERWFGSTRAKRRWLGSFLVGVSLVSAIAACSSNSTTTTSSPSSQTVAQQSNDVQLTLVSFAVTKAAHDAIIPKFVAQWQKDHNQTVSFEQASYGGSGSQTQKVLEGGLDADVVHLALGLDVNKLVTAGLVSSDWQQQAPHNGIVSRSVVALATHPGNPKGINSFADLTKPGVTLVTANPKTSGVARWNFLALWNSVVKAGGDETKALDFVTQVYKNVPELPGDARVATETFYKRGLGDVLLNYENEIILAKQRGEKVEYVVPDVNISIENPVAIVEKNVAKHGNRDVAEAFVKFLYTPDAQAEFAKVGFRPVDEAIAKEKEVMTKYPTVPTLSTVQDFGGWEQVQQKFFEDGAIFDQIQTRIKQTKS
ncbi:MAG: sulfate ABC transporter substrate-binding protein [Stenomitos rutilans HA7619-LM2]|jgi:sulfate transport system substrate-binding protein|nr:sulfate ABC transporter substrate-binding protein [Stenomitos rutilans HA7619-LM2]